MILLLYIGEAICECEDGIAIGVQLCVHVVHGYPIGVCNIDENDKSSYAVIASAQNVCITEHNRTRRCVYVESNKKHLEATI